VLTSKQIDQIRAHWTGNPLLLGEPNAEKDSNIWPHWESSIFMQRGPLKSIHLGRSQLVIGRKGSGKSAARIAAERASGVEAVESGTARHIAMGASAERLIDSAINDFEIRQKAGAAAVSVWYKIFAHEILKGVARTLGGQALVDQAEVEIRRWAIAEGFALEDFGERLVVGMRRLFPQVRERTEDPKSKVRLREENVEKLLRSSKCTLIVDDFDNTANSSGDERLGVRNVQAAIEAADLLSSRFDGPNISLLIREDLWLRCRIGWHYLDKISMPMWLQWDATDLKDFVRVRLAVACSIALGEEENSRTSEGFHTLWNIFFPDTVSLENGSASQGFTYVLRRTMYTPRDIQTFLQFALMEGKRLPLSAIDIQRAEEKFSTERMQYVINEFGAMCEGLSQCLHSFAGHALEWTTSDLRTLIKGQMGMGNIKPNSAACADPKSPTDMLRFLFRIGFLEVRLPADPKDRAGEYEVRDGLRHPDHWSGARVDDSVKWAVRSTFYQALQAYRADNRSSIGTGRKVRRP
jgi:hypothetical protein